MALTNAFYEAVNTGNVRRVRIMMQDSLLIDPTFAEFYEMEKAAAQMTGLYDIHDGKAFMEDKSQWNDDYMDKVMVNILSNFSHERMEHLKDVVHYLRPVAKKVPPKTQKTRRYHDMPKGSYEEEKRRSQENGDYLYAKIGMGAIVTATVGGVIASIAGASVVGGAVTGAVVGGVATAVIINGR